MSTRQAVLTESIGPGAWSARTVVSGNGARRVFPSLSDRFWSQVVEGSGDCWLWAGDCTDDGYGRFSINPIYVGRAMSLWQILLAAWIPVSIVVALRLGPFLRRLDPGETTYETDLMELVQPENLSTAEVDRRFASLIGPLEAERDRRLS